MKEAARRLASLPTPLLWDTLPVLSALRRLGLSPFPVLSALRRLGLPPPRSALCRLGLNAFPALSERRFRGLAAVPSTLRCRGLAAVPSTLRWRGLTAVPSTFRRLGLLNADLSLLLSRRNEEVESALLSRLFSSFVMRFLSFNLGKRQANGNDKFKYSNEQTERHHQLHFLLNQETSGSMMNFHHNQTRFHIQGPEYYYYSQRGCRCYCCCCNF